MSGGLLAFLRRLPPAPDSDDALLDRFARGRDADAFAALVARHGPMVFAVCWRALRDGASAEDAFQAVFVALARDAGRVGTRGAISGWLYRVALRTARRLAARPRALDPLPPDAPAPNAPDAARRELLAALDDEVNALPDRLRAAVVLCALEGRTNSEAAAVLGCPVGTVDSRLHAAKRKLRDRLTRRGFGLPAIGTAVGAISLETAQNADAASRLAPSVLAALTGGPLAPAVATILQEMMPVRPHFKLFAATGFALALAGVGFALHAAGEPLPVAVPPPPPAVPPPAAAPAAPAAPKPATDAEYQNALVAAIHRLADDSRETEHLAVLLERHPKLVNERVTYKQMRKPSIADSYTALHFAARRGHTEAVAVLLQHKADPNAATGTDWTPLHLAAQGGHLEICKMLVKAGAKLDAKTIPLPGGVPPGTGFGEKPVVLPPIPALTPLDLAKGAKHAAVVEYLTALEKQPKP